MPTDTKLLCWVDLETIGDTIGDPILEAAVVITDWKLRVIADAEVLIDSPDWMALLERNEAAWKMHTRSGLVSDLLGGKGVPLRAAEQNLIDLLNSLGHIGGFAQAGYGVMWYRKVLTAHMPLLERWLHPTRSLELADVRNFVARVCERRDLVPMVEDDAPHRALLDIHRELVELRHYQKIVQGIART